MLVLSRKSGERIHIGDQITIEVRRVAGNRVTLALDAPRSLRILRGELQKAANEFRPADEDEDQCQSPTYIIASRRMPLADAVGGHEATRDFVI